MPSEEKYMELFSKGCDLSEGLIHIDGEEHKEIGFFDRRKLKKARSLFELSTIESPSNAAPYLMLAKVSRSLSEKSASLEYLIKAWNLEPANLVLVVELSTAYGVPGKPKEAISVLEEGIKYYPDEPRILFNLGISYLLENKSSLAVELFQKTVEIEPEFQQNHELLEYSREVFAGTKPTPKNHGDIAQNI